MNLALLGDSGGLAQNRVPLIRLEFFRRGALKSTATAKRITKLRLFRRSYTGFLRPFTFMVDSIGMKLRFGPSSPLDLEGGVVLAGPEGFEPSTSGFRSGVLRHLSAGVRESVRFSLSVLILTRLRAHVLIAYCG